MAIIDKINIETRFQLNNSPDKTFKFTDLTDYVAEGIILTNVFGYFKITNPIGQVYYVSSPGASSPDITLSTQNFTSDIPISLDSNGEALQGSYIVEYTVAIFGLVEPGTYTKVFAYDFCYKPVEIKIGIGVNMIAATLTSTDLTTYPTNLTNSSRTHSIHPPASQDPADYPVQTVATTVNEYTPLATNTWTSKITSVLELTYNADTVYDGHVVDVTISGSEEVNVRDDFNSCSLRCYITSLQDRYNKEISTNPINAERMFDNQLAPAVFNYISFDLSIKCGHFDKAETYYKEVLKYTDADCGCGCDDADESVPVMPVSNPGGGGGSGQTYNVISANDSIGVTPSTVGDETTFELRFSPYYEEFLASLKRINIVSTDNTVLISDSTTGSNKTFDISAPAPNINNIVHEQHIGTETIIIQPTSGSEYVFFGESLGLTHTIAEDGVYEIYFNANIRFDAAYFDMTFEIDTKQGDLLDNKQEPLIAKIVSQDGRVPITLNGYNATLLKDDRIRIRIPYLTGKIESTRVYLNYCNFYVKKVG